MPVPVSVPYETPMNAPYMNSNIQSIPPPPPPPQEPPVSSDDLVSIPTNVPVQQVTSDLTKSYPNVNTYVDQSPRINPNFSRIIDLSVTPSPPPITEEPSETSNDDYVSSPSKSIETPTHHENAEPKIPLSHLIATNQYPSLSRIPPANIVQSFAPVYNQTNLQSHQQQSYAVGGENEELYSSYVNNPYNLTLQVDQNFSNPPVTSATTTNQVSAEPPQMMQPSTNPSNLNVFQSINYFGATTDATIPPGSEMLFGGP